MCINLKTGWLCAFVMERVLSCFKCLKTNKKSITINHELQKKKNPKLLSKLKRKAFFSFGFYTLVTSQIMTDLARIWLKYECELETVKFIYSFNKYLNVSKVTQFKALVTQVATLMARHTIISK